MRVRDAIAAGVLAGALAAAAPAAAAAAGPSFASGTGCEEQQAWVEGDEGAVEAHLPDGYEPVRAGSGAPLLFVRALSCAGVSLDGGPADPAVVAGYGVVVESPDGLGCGSGTPVIGPHREGPPICNWYPLRTLTDDRRLARWFGDQLAAAHVPGLVFDWRDLDPARGGAPGHVRAPGWAIDTLTRERPGELGVRGGYWAETRGGTFKLAVSTDELISSGGSATVTAEPGSELATLLGAPQRSAVPPYDAFTAQRFDHGVYRQQWLAPAAGARSFEGSCTTEGDVTFAPPARNEPQQLVYDYVATGTCTGTLDGREIEDAPVTVRHSGPAEGGCESAQTTAPGRGALTFGNGTSIGYTLDFRFTATEGTAMLYGDRAGTAHAQASFLTPRSSPGIALQCGGEGVRRAPMDASFTTHRPLVSQPEPRRRRRPAARRPRGRGRQAARVEATT
ncbi:MAG TPA: hypothetical protein VHF89_06775 [Solirubrobacteraceae bacterium]|nr:hypothetical protein [Solirubrobacteraceae bacterium]